MRSSSIRRRLMLSISLLAIGICVLFGILTFVSAYIVEDVFFSSLLRADAEHVARGGADTQPRLPFVQRFDRWQDVPAEVRSGAASVNSREVAGQEGRHYHIRRVQMPAGDVWLVAEVSSLLAVRPMRLQILAILAPAAMLILVGSIALAAVISRRGVRQLDELAAAVKSGETQGLTQYAQDRELRLVAEALENAFARVEGLLDRERAFVGDVSHELRSPLAIIRGAAEVLEQQNAESAHLRPQLTRILDATTSGQQVIDLMLALAREETAHEIAKEIHVLPLVERILLRQDAVANRTDLVLEVDVSPAMRVHAPAKAVEVILDNLIGNALRHGAGAIQIRGTEDTLTVRNGRSQGAGDRPRRQGIGVNLVRRLAGAAGIGLEIEMSEAGALAAITFPAAGRDPDSSASPG